MALRTRAPKVHGLTIAAERARRRWSAATRATWCSRTRPSWGAMPSPTRHPPGPACWTTAPTMDAQSVGLTRSEIVLGKRSSSAALRQAFEEMGYDIDGDELKAAFVRFKEIADRKKQVSALDDEGDPGRPHPRAQGPLPPLRLGSRSRRAPAAAWARVEVAEGADDTRAMARSTRRWAHRAHQGRRRAARVRRARP